MKERIVLSQFNWAYDHDIYIPLAAGVLAAVVREDADLRNRYNVDAWLRFERGNPKQIADEMGDVDVAGFSISVWNTELSLSVARHLKYRRPNCMTVFGGPSVPARPQNLLDTHSQVDVAIRGEGEHAFANLLRARPPLDSSSCAIVVKDREKDLSNFPSPFLTGVFDETLKRPYHFNGILECARGCPYSCLAGNTIIALPDRLLRFDEEVYSAVKIRCGTTTHSHYVGAHDERVMHQGTKECIEISLSNGTTLTPTPDHPLYRVENDVLVEHAASALKVGDWVPVQVGQNKITKEVPLLPLSMVIYPPGIGRRRPEEIKTPKTLNIDLAWWLGYLVGDGCLPTDDRPTVQFAVTPPVRKKLLRLAKKLFGLKMSVYTMKHTKKCESGEIRSRMLVRFLKETLGIGVREEKLRVPRALWRSPPAVVRAFLRGLWTADGHQPQKGEAYLVTVSKHLAEECAALLHWIGDAAVIRTVPQRPGRFPQGNWSKGGWSYRVEWHTRSCRERLIGQPCVGSRIPTQAGEGIRFRQKGPNKGAPYVSASGKHTHGASRALYRQVRPESPLLADDLVFVQVAAVRAVGLQDVYDVHNHPDHRIAANGVLSHNCTFCDWGSNTNAKIMSFPDERLLAELTWFADHKIEHIYCADANWGILPRDMDLTRKIATQRRERGYPRSWFVNYPKNSTKKIFDLAKLLHDEGLCRGATLSMQSYDEQTLVNIHRGNIKLSTYRELQKLYNDAGVPTYTELIVPLVGETLESFCAGVDTAIDAGQHNGLFIYLCRVLPGTGMAEPSYRKKFGITTIQVPIQANHADLDADDGVAEYEETVVQTDAMPMKDWLTALRVSWFVITFHQMKMAYFPLEWLRSLGVTVTQFARWFVDPNNWDTSNKSLLLVEMHRVASYLSSLVNAHPVVPRDGIDRFQPIRWPLDEATWLALSVDRDSYFAEMREVVTEYCEKHHIKCDTSCEAAWIEQKTRLVHWATDPVYKDPAEFAKHRVWFGRRGGSFLKEQP